MTSGGDTAWEDARLAAALFAVDPPGCGVLLRAAAGPVRDRWLALLHELLPAGMRVRRVPPHVPDERLLGGLDFAATLARGRPVAARGILAEANGDALVFVMAERLPPATAARLGRVLDTGEVSAEREGLSDRIATRFGVIALDEGAEPDERPPASFCDRLGIRLDLGTVGLGDADPVPSRGHAVEAARARLEAIRPAPDQVELLCAAAMELGVDSLRAPALALRVARASAALAGRSALAEEDLALAARLVLAPRATRLPGAASAPADRPHSDASEPATSGPHEGEHGGEDAASGTEPGNASPDPDGGTSRVLAAARSALPSGLLERMRAGAHARAPAAAAGRSGARRAAALRGRPAGSRRGQPGRGARLDLVATLRAAVPWQRLRRTGGRMRPPGRLQVELRRDDLHVRRFRQRTETTVVFAVDASGSTALQRLAEAKGAVELLLARCYVRRDHVALVSFRGAAAELLLPPTRSLTRARRALAGLPGGGGTPLAAGIETAAEVADAVRRRGGTALLVLLTDGRANVARDGRGGREQAWTDALAAAGLLRAAGVAALLVDTSPRPQPPARELAAAAGALYLPLPHADSASLCDAIAGARASRAQEAASARPAGGA